MAVFKYIIGGTVLCLFLMDSVQGKYNKATFPTAMDAFSTLSCSFSEIDNNTLGWNIYQILDVTSLYVLLGSRERVYVLNADDMTVKNSVPLELKNTSVDYGACELVNGVNTEYVCQNYISFGYFKNSTAYRVCGTYNSERPHCYDCSVEEDCYKNISVDNMPRRPQQNFSSTGPIDVGGSEFYFIGGLVNHYSQDPLFSKVNVESGTEAVKTDEIESQWLEEPVDFVGEPMDYGGHIYFVYREKAEEYSNIGNVIYSRIGRVCKNDTGGIAAPLNGNFLTFLKARLTCSVGSEFPFYFDIVQDTVRDGDYFYGMFTTTSGGTASTAICRYDLREIEDLFNEDNRRGQESSDKLWLEVTRHSDDTEARRTCAQAYELGSNSIYSHLEKYPLLNTNVVSCGFGQTCTYPRGLDESVTDALAVLEGVKGQEFAIYKSSETSITVFIGTNNRKILNVSISADSAEVLEEIIIERRTFSDTYLDQRWPYGVRDITIENDRVYATMDECAINFGVSDSLPPLPSTIKDRTDMYDKKKCTHRRLPSSVTNCFLLFEGEEGTEIEAEFDTDLHAGTYNVNSKRFNTAQGCREFLHVHIIIRDDKSLNCSDKTTRTCTYPGNVTVSSASGKTSPIVVPFDIDVDSSGVETRCNRTAVMDYDYKMAVYRYEFKEWLRDNVTCENAEMNVCPSPQACNGDV